MLLNDSIQLILSGKLPQNHCLNIDLSNATSEDLLSLTSALCSDKAPQGLVLSLFDDSYRGDPNEVCPFLANVISSGYAPKELTLGLFVSRITNIGFSYIASAISSGKAPQGLKIDFGFNDISDEGALYLAKALSSGSAPQGLELNLDYNKISDKGAIFLTNALSSGKAPQGLQLDLSDCLITAEGINYLVQTIKQDKHPIDLKIEIDSPEVEAALEESKLRRLFAQAYLALMQKRELTAYVNGNEVIKHIPALPLNTLSHIARFVLPQGKEIARNAISFFRARSTYQSPLSNLKIDLKKVKEKMGIMDVGTMIQDTLLRYIFNSDLSPEEIEIKIYSLVMALQKIDVKENQTIVLNEIAVVPEQNNQEQETPVATHKEDSNNNINIHHEEVMDLRRRSWCSIS